jgi:hypothetical protein
MLSGDGRLLVGTTAERDAFGVWGAASGRLLARLCFPEAVDVSHMRCAIDDGRYAVFAGPTTSLYVFRLPPAADKRP